MRDTNLATTNTVSSEANTIFAPSSDGQMQAGVLAQDLMTELMGVVPVLGDRKVNVGFAGTGAFCDKNLSYVNIPALPPARIIPLQIAQEIRGFAAHEAAHLAFTDSEIDIVDDTGAHNPLLHTIWNCIEDFMIERNWLELYPGAKKNFAATETRCSRGYLEQYTQDPDVARDLRRVGPIALTWLRAMHFGLGTQTSRDSFSTLNGEFQRRVTGWFTEMLDVECTQDCLDLAKEIYIDIDADPFDPNNMPQGGGQGGGGGSQGKGSQNGPGAQGAGSGSGAKSGAAAPGVGPYNGPKPIPTSANLDDSIKEQGLATNETVSTQVISSASSGPQSTSLANPDGYTIAQNAMQQIQGQTAAITMQLRRALKIKAKTRFKSGRQNGIIDGSKIAIAASGGLDYHRRKIKGEEIDTAVTFLIDCSGSMGGHEIQVCQEMSLAMEGALNGTKIKHEIIGFTTADTNEADDAFKIMIEADEKNGGNAEFRAIAMYEFRKFGQSHTDALRTIGNMTSVGMGGTPTAPAMLLAHDRLSRRPEKRQVMFVMTDGSSDDTEAVRAAEAAMKACKVTVIGVGICSEHVKHEFDHHVVINDISDLPAVMMSKITSILLGEQNQVAVTGQNAKKDRDRKAA